MKMKKIGLVLAFGVLLTFVGHAKKIDGKILFESDTIDVVFNVPIKFFSGEPDFQRLQFRVKYYDSEGLKHILKPDDAKEIQFSYKSESIRMISHYNSINAPVYTTSRNIFLKLQIDDKLKLYNYYYTQSSAGYYNAGTGVSSGGTYYTVEKYVLQKGNGALKRPKNLGFKNDMIAYFSDCPSLVEKIESKEFRKGDLEAIVAYYNLNCE